LLSSNGFLEFIIRNDLKIQLNNHALIYGLIAAAAGILAMLLPITKYAGRSVIGQKEEKRSGMRAQSYWHRYFLDVILLAVSIYGLYSFSGSEEILMSRVIAGESLDPLLFLSTAAFMAGASLFLLRLVPLFEKLLFRLFKEKWSPALFASHRQVLGTRREQGFIMLFLAMTAASGIFYAAAARTVRENDERNLSYLTGADLIAEERWQSNAAELLAKAEAGDPDAANQPLTYYEPNFEKYESLSGFSSATKVYNHAGKLDYTGLDKAAQQLTIMAVEPKKFGETAEFDASLMSVHWYDFLNVLSLREDAVILSANYRAFGISIGDQVYLRTTEKNVNDSIKLTVYGFVDYWPGYKPQEIEIMSDESTVKKDAYLAVFRLDTAQRAWKVLPYEVWMKSEDGGTESFYRLAEEREIPLRSVRDRASLIQAEASSAIKQGTSGIFTVSFILTLVLCTVGFLIYWISSVKNRELQFGVLRAMGLRFREIVAMLLNEQLFVSVSAIAIGYAVGILTSKLYMPLIRVAYSSAEYPVPLELVRMAGDELRLFAVIGIMLLVGLYIIAGIVRRMKISEALKLGED
ncbi:MAG: ABC transporter permease, partial [Lachnospiraceae bacterium]|nr:ABC transporter permease [Lachnospiraceae bacterium]